MEVSLTGDDVAIINGRVLKGVADGDWVKLDFDAPLAMMKVGKNGNTMYARNAPGQMVKMTLRVLMGSPDDIQLNAWKAQMQADFSAFNLLSGSFTKRVGDGAGAVREVIYELSGGIFSKEIPASSSAEGNTEQSVAVYEMQFLLENRPIQ